MSPQQWAAAWKTTLSTGKPFDDIIDALTPVMQPNLQQREKTWNYNRTNNE
jgi:hypothetical protein